MANCFLVLAHQFIAVQEGRGVLPLPPHPTLAAFQRLPLRSLLPLIHAVSPLLALNVVVQHQVEEEGQKEAGHHSEPAGAALDLSRPSCMDGFTADHVTGRLRIRMHLLQRALRPVA